MEAKALLVPFLAERGLELSEEKTLVTSIAHGFDFLGWNFRKHEGKLITKPSKGSVDAFLAETHWAILVDGRGMSRDDLIRLLSPKVRGFANYHRHACSSKAFSRIAHVMYLQLRRWARRRHPTKGLRWVYPRYWFSLGADNYVFGTPELYLPPMTWQHIVRHTPLTQDRHEPLSGQGALREEGSVSQEARLRVLPQASLTSVRTRA